MTSVHDRLVEAPGRTHPARRFTIRPARGPWWVTPAGSIAMVVPLSLVVAVQIPDSDYRMLYGAPRVITPMQTLLFLAAATVLALGSTVFGAAANVTAGRWPAFTAPGRTMLSRAEIVAFRLTTLGYVLFVVLGLARGATPALLVRAVTSQDNYTGQLKTVFAPVAGVTSLTQVGVAQVVIAALLLCGGRDRAVVRRLTIVILLGLLRSYFLTERLALLELLVPLLVVAAVRLRQRTRGTGWLPFAPVLALPILCVVFGAFEYSRSWVFFRTRTTQSFPLFVVNRLAGYYATSYNNGALVLDHPVAHRLPYASIEAFWTAPGIAQSNLYQLLTGQAGTDQLSTTLAQYGNPEFNNPGGLAVPLIDWGIVGGLAYFLLAGLVIGAAYRGWRRSDPLGLLVYPVLFTGLLELPRYLYWTQGRALPGLVFLVVTAVVVRRAEPIGWRPQARSTALR